MDGKEHAATAGDAADTAAIGPVPPRPSTDSEGWVLGDRYRVVSRIGSGGMAEVFRAQDRVLDRPVAVKVFRKEHVARDDAHGVERQQLEVAALARLNHPNLITLYDGSIGGESGPAYIVMELIDGPSLASKIAEGPLPEPAVREIGIQLADGLAYVHAQGMVHRDVKPENILLGVDRSDDDSTVRARLSDFGIVRLLGSERLTNVNFTLGTASYLAPEQARGSDVDPPADVYALALVLLEALTGVKAFDGPPIETAMARLSQRPHIPANLPAPWPALLYAMTEFDPALRPPAAEVARVLRNEGSRSLPLAAAAIPAAAGFATAPTGMIPAAAAGAPFVGDPTGVPPGVAPSGPVPVKRRRRPPALVVVAAVSLLAIAGVLGAFLLTGNDSKAPAAPPSIHVTSPAADRTTTGHHVVPARQTSAPAGSGTAPARTGPRSSAGASHSSAPRTSSAPSTSSAPRTSSAPPTSQPPTSSVQTTAPPSSPAGSSQPVSSQQASSPAAASSRPRSPNSTTTSGAGG